MRKIILNLTAIGLIIIAGIAWYCYGAKSKELIPKKIVAKSVFGRKGNGEGEFEGLLSLAIKGEYLFVADSGNNRIQVLEIK